MRRPPSPGSSCAHKPSFGWRKISQAHHLEAGDVHGDRRCCKPKVTLSRKWSCATFTVAQTSSSSCSRSCATCWMAEHSAVMTCCGRHRSQTKSNGSFKVVRNRPFILSTMCAGLDFAAFIANALCAPWTTCQPTVKRIIVCADKSEISAKHQGRATPSLS